MLLQFWKQTVAEMLLNAVALITPSFKLKGLAQILKNSYPSSTKVLLALQYAFW